MKIGELAQRTGISIETIRFYEAQGLLPPPARAANNYRVYTPEHAEQLAFIAKCRSLDMAHTEIRRLLELQANPQASCEEINNLLDEHLRHVQARIAELNDLKQQIEAIGRRCTTAASVAECGVLQSLHEEAVAGNHAGHGHDHGDAEHAHKHIRGVHR
ncbi:Mercuric resistance operon regulatory protein [Ralstonia mannitolilytica]|uniref:Cd(II)/Pb(II)-responsive transcriptional regulator n=1 Tax=Ralstonia mannitolilytica TaxID=105219 RepID=UPI0007AFE7E1|nr:Cd(II)/Pb(II)-responsive transcriptional regulator [Ralstonia mannitolilytica]ANA35022.1 MerR family transcriptional regulator [Ralstonia mannitolilytica]CAJ0689318.1 Mercuric resistance operon regulatory protein [Ralstonia mannitolilytica]CAJ0796527.1 Mercuric resistance operon regulatory protein [Ralstonia mannitolilytica]CAJ0870479.1 Mercuric resistance operon regulatory protein [Ralstonia mannitolilytica]